MICRYPS
jgi:hypothetical protein